MVPLQASGTRLAAYFLNYFVQVCGAASCLEGHTTGGGPRLWLCFTEKMGVTLHLLKVKRPKKKKKKKKNPKKQKSNQKLPPALSPSQGSRAGRPGSRSEDDSGQ